jgi:TonB family protein
MQATLIPSALSSQPRLNTAPEPRLQTTITNEVPRPDIEIQAAVRAGSGIGAISAAIILPPRPDPAIRNASPALPTAFVKLGSEVEVLLTILVNSDGSVGDARVARSCGEALLDQLAQSFAKANWRFRAAAANGLPVSDWATVMVKFAPAG